MSNSGRIMVVGLGPGDPAHMTYRAREALMSSDVIVGYKTYIDLVRGIVPGKPLVSSGMRREVDRAREALGLAGEGKAVSIISSGDPGVYGMAGLVLELVAAMDGEAPEVEIIPGVTAILAAAARLGAPLMHDFAVISLSDLLTPWAKIEERLEAAARSDMVIVLYNPRSKGRPDHLEKACEIISRFRNEFTPVGLVRNAMRGDEERTLCQLGQLPYEKVDMLTVVVVGNSQTRNIGDWIVTPRGYRV